MCKAAGTFKMLYPMLHRRSEASTDNKLLLYKQVVRPILTYGCQVFCSIANTHFRKLQVAQNEYLRQALGYDRYARLHDMHLQTSIKPIKEHIMCTSEKFYITTVFLASLRMTYSQCTAGIKILENRDILQISSEKTPKSMENTQKKYL